MVNPKLFDLIELCITISKTTEHDVFFTYYPNAGHALSIHYYIDGWNINSDVIYLNDISVEAEDIEFENAISTLRKELL